MLQDPFVLTPGFEGRNSRAATSRCSMKTCKLWTAPFVMANINTRNVHRSNMLMGFPYGKDFVYDEMVLTGPGEQGEANAKRVMAANNESGWTPARPKPGEGPSKEERENGYYDLLFVGDRARRQAGPRGRPGDRDPGYGSTSKMISECAICLLRDTPDVPARHLDARRGHGQHADQAAGRSRRPHV